MNRDLLTKEIEWLCFHAVGEGILSKEQCIAVMEAIEENGLTADLQLFVDIVEGNDICPDVQRLKADAERVRQEARMLGFPPRSVFDDAPASAPVAEEVPQPAQQSAAQAPLPRRQPVRKMQEAQENVDNGYPRKVCEDPWAQGWPRLADADGMEWPQARELLNEFLNKARENHCSDVHISAGALPFVRRYKRVFLLPGQAIVSEAASEALNLSPLDEGQLAHFREAHDLDYGYNISSDNRYRTNIMHHRQGVSGAYRIIDNNIRTISQLGFEMPEVVEKLTTYGQGLILVTGPAGSGKSSTLAALVEHLNKSRQDHIITVEDPIELVYEPKGCNITQRELNKHTKSFGNALRAALREDPDIIVIGEMRDLETIEMAIHASETGHLVIGTLHTSSAPDTMTRLLDVFPPEQQGQIRGMVAESLKGVICQQLLPNIDGSNVVMAYEILLGVLAVSNLIREGKTYQLESTIQTSKHLGMISMEQCHFNLYMAGKRSYEQTLPFIKNKDLLRQMQINEASNLGTGNGGRKAAPQPPPPPPSAPEAAPDEAPAKKKGWFGFGK
ncbi:MAG: PilT/PilU family type 4a pilus ATPase [Victivallales bacterium]|nr:PilT/PilU family type 4a pilus ATPase [Victivallales bacterium]